MLLETGQRLVENGHELTAILTAPQQPHYDSSVEDFLALAEKTRAHFRCDGQVENSDIDVMLSTATDVGISINWPRLVDRGVLSVFRFGVLNGHAGDLPRYRGNACLNWAILNRESEVAVVVHGMEPHAVDVGPIYARKRRQLKSTDYVGDLYDWLLAELPQLFLDVIGEAAVLDKLPEPLLPGPGPSMRCYPRQESDSMISWLSTSGDIAALVRASSRPLSGAYTTLRGSEIRVWRAQSAQYEDRFCAVPGQVLKQDHSGLFVACAEGVLHIEEWSSQSPRNLPKRYTAAVRFGSE